MYKNILVPIDGSATSNLALKEAITLAQENSSIVKVIYVLDPFSITPDIEYFTMQDIVQSMRAEGAVILEKARKKLLAAGIHFDVKMVEVNTSGERIPEAIAREAKRWPANLIVVGTHGRKGFSHFLLGSVAESIIRIATKPVLLIRGKGR